MKDIKKLFCKHNILNCLIRITASCKEDVSINAVNVRPSLYESRDGMWAGMFA